MSADDFYRVFEDRHRGSREAIKRRLTVYLPFLKPLREVYPEWRGVDLGCGRGEWLELLSEHGCQSFGVDLDDGMLADCLDRGLLAARQEAVLFLKTLAEESQAVVSGFHLVEHIEFESLRELVREAFRVLKPGGLLILETPNPENIVVGTDHFYLDPTHLRPLPPELLSFVPDYYGFLRTKVMRLQEPKVLIDEPNIRLLDVIGGVSPDYAVIAQKAGADEVISLFNIPFEQEYGLTLETLASRHDAMGELRSSRLSVRLDEMTEALRQVRESAHHAGTGASQAEARAQQVETMAQQAETRAQQAETRAQQAETRAQQAETRAQQAGMKANQADTIAQLVETKARQSEERAQKAEARACTAESTAQSLQLALQNVETDLDALYSSRSWRLTTPLRLLRGRVRGLAKPRVSPLVIDRRGLKALMLRAASRCRAVIVKSPQLHSLARRVNKRFPWIRQRLWRRFAHRNLDRPVQGSDRGVPLSPRSSAIPLQVRRANEDLRRHLDLRTRDRAKGA